MNRINRNQIILSVIAVVIVGALAFTYFWQEEEPVELIDGFTHGMDDWAKDRDLPMDPNNPGNEVDWNITHVQDLTDPSYGVVRLYVDGSQDDGTIWIEREVELKPNKRYNGTLSFKLYSESESFNQIAAVVGYVGPADPESEGDFAVLGPANQVEGWKTYRHSVVFRTGSDGEAWVACGISVRWETKMIYLIDDVLITFN